MSAMVASSSWNFPAAAAGAIDPKHMSAASAAGIHEVHVWRMMGPLMGVGLQPDAARARRPTSTGRANVPAAVSDARDQRVAPESIAAREDRHLQEHRHVA